MNKPRDEIYIEMQKVGAGIEVRAVAASDGLEVSFIAPVSATRSQIEDLSLAKLAYVRRKGQGGDGGASGAGGRGVIV